MENVCVCFWFLPDSLCTIEEQNKEKAFYFFIFAMRKKSDFILFHIVYVWFDNKKNVLI